MDLKEYTAKPDEGMFEQISRRLRRRRLMRMGGMVAVVVTVAALTLLIGGNGSEPEGGTSVAQNAGQVVQSVVRRQLQSEEVAAEKPTVTVGEKTQPLAQAKQVTLPAEEQLVALVVEETQPMVKKSAPVTSNIMRQEKVKPAMGEMQKMKSAAAQPSVVEPSVVQPEEIAVTVANGESHPTKDPGNTPIHIDDLMWAPNVIVPDGEVDDNRTFKLSFSSTVTEFKLYIYNRGGRLLFTSTNPSEVWDATHHGERLPQGTYVWVVQFRDTDGYQRQEKGTVTVIR